MMYSTRNRRSDNDHVAGGNTAEQPLPVIGGKPSVTVQCRFGGVSNEVDTTGNAPATSDRTGLPASLRAGLESLSGYDLSAVRVHYNSPKPAQVGALAYTQGADIHLGHGQERHLPHEGWHAVQQMQGRVRPTVQYKKTAINDDAGLEKEADVMGARAQHAAATGGSAPATAAGTRPVQGVMQRKIDFSTQSLFLGDVNTLEELIEAAQRLFPRLDGIEAVVREIDGLRPRWTLHDVYRELSRRASLIPEPISTGELQDTIMLPSRSSYRNDFAFTTKTRLRGRVERRASSPLPLRDASQRNRRFHAEDDLMEQLNELLTSRRISRNDTIHITINNSPCLGRCAPNLARWFQRYWRGRMVIRYANPYGSFDEFAGARRLLIDAGIEISSFPVERYLEMNTLTVKQRARFEKMRRRRRDYRRRWNEKYPDDASEGSDDESSRSSSPEPRSRSRSRSRSPVRSSRHRSRSDSDSDSRSPSPERGRRERRLRIPGTLRDVSGNGMDCLIRAVLYAALGNVDETAVGLIRAELIRQHVAAEGRMLDLAGAAGAVMITFMVFNNILPANRGIVVYTPGPYGGVVSHTVLAGVNPIRLWLADEHFQAIV